MNADRPSLTPEEVIAQCVRLDALFDETYARQIDFNKSAQHLAPQPATIEIAPR